MDLFCFQAKPFIITVIQLFAPTTDVKGANVDRFFKDLRHLLELTLKKKKKFFPSVGNWDAKVGSQEILGITVHFCLEAQNEAGKRLTEFCRKNTLVIEIPLPTIQETTPHMGITRWSIPKSD